MPNDKEEPEENEDDEEEDEDEDEDDEEESDDDEGGDSSKDADETTIADVATDVAEACREAMDGCSSASPDGSKIYLHLEDDTRWLLTIKKRPSR